MCWESAAESQISLFVVYLFLMNRNLYTTCECCNFFWEEVLPRVLPNEHLYLTSWDLLEIIFRDVNPFRSFNASALNLVNSLNLSSFFLCRVVISSTTVAWIIMDLSLFWFSSKIATTLPLATPPMPLMLELLDVSVTSNCPSSMSSL